MQSQFNSPCRDNGFQAWPPKRALAPFARLETAGLFWRHHKEHWLASLNSPAEGDLRKQSI
jgi:hypothetical protein